MATLSKLQCAHIIHWWTHPFPIIHPFHRELAVLNGLAVRTQISAADQPRSSAPSYAQAAPAIEVPVRSSSLCADGSHTTLLCGSPGVSPWGGHMFPWRRSCPRFSPPNVFTHLGLWTQRVQNGTQKGINTHTRTWSQGAQVTYKCPGQEICHLLRLSVCSPQIF